MLSEPFWKQTKPIEIAWDNDPGNGDPAPAKGYMHIAYDSGNLYVGIEAHDPNPAAIRAHYADRDTMQDNDFVGLYLDTFNDQKRAFVFMVNPAGVQYDAIYDDQTGNEDATWDAIWNSAARRTDFGYVVEMAIPYSALRFEGGPSPKRWGIMASRIWPRDRAYLLQSYQVDRNQSSTLSQIDEIEGFAGARPSSNILLIPTLTGTGRKNAIGIPGTDYERNDEAEAGLTASWNPSPNITFNAAFNPDFSQIEADEVQLDINEQFSLFFEETRPFFLESQDYFQTPIQAVYTRTIADPPVALKATGKQGSSSFGLFYAEDDITQVLLPGSQRSSIRRLSDVSDNMAARFRHDIGSNSTIGALATWRQSGDYENIVTGIDGFLRLSRSDSLSFQALGSRTTYPDGFSAAGDSAGNSIDGHAMYVNLQRTRRHYVAYIRYEDFSTDFRTDLGFEPRVDYRSYRIGGRRQWWFDRDAFLNRLYVGGEWEFTEDQKGEQLRRETDLYAILWMPLQSFARVTVGAREETFAGRQFDQQFSSIVFRMLPVAGFSYSVGISWADDIDFSAARPARRFNWGPNFRINLGRHLYSNIRYSYRRLEVADGRLFTANVGEVSTTYHFNTRVWLRTTLQYSVIDREQENYLRAVEARSEDFLAQILFTVKLNPRTVLFFGYNDEREGTEFRPLDINRQSLFFKVGYAWEL